jgi:hypothetical protein
MKLMNKMETSFNNEIAQIDSSFKRSFDKIKTNELYQENSKNIDAIKTAYDNEIKQLNNNFFNDQVLCEY